MNDPLQKRPAPALVAAMVFVAAAYVVTNLIS